MNVGTYIFLWMYYSLLVSFLSSTFTSNSGGCLNFFYWGITNNKLSIFEIHNLVDFNVGRKVRWSWVSFLDLDLSSKLGTLFSLSVPTFLTWDSYLDHFTGFFRGLNKSCGEPCGKTSSYFRYPRTNGCCGSCLFPDRKPETQGGQKCA